MYENRLKHPRNPLIGYLNINSLRNKIAGAGEVFGKLQLDYFVLSETKLDDSFPSAQFYIENFEIKNRRDRDKKWRWAYRICKKKNMKQSLVKQLLLSLPYQRKSGFVLVSIGHPLWPT